MFIREAVDTSAPFVGKVWPGDAVFPDFFRDTTVEWWKGLISEFHENVGFDGLWLDMNEIANFCDGVCYPEQKK